MENNHCWKDGNAQMDTNLQVIKQSFIQENLSRVKVWHDHDRAMRPFHNKA